jgi:hypothetical protein
MSHFKLVKIIALLLLLTGAAFQSSAQTPPPSSHDAEWRIAVDGTILAGPGAAARRLGERFWLPLPAIARTLGDALEIDAAN